MLTEKILFKKSSLVFSLPSATPPPGLVKDHTFPEIFFGTFPLKIMFFPRDLDTHNPSGKNTPLYTHCTLSLSQGLQQTVELLPTIYAHKLAGKCPFTHVKFKTLLITFYKIVCLDCRLQPNADPSCRSTDKQLLEAGAKEVHPWTLETSISPKQSASL